MPPSTRIPPLLQPYVQLPRHESLLLLTSTLGASANWLLVRFLCNALSNDVHDGVEENGHNVVLVSWMRGYDFWKHEARKGAGLDLEKLKREGRLSFVDGLGGLCLDTSSAQVGGHTSPERKPLQSPAVGTVGGSPAQRGPSITSPGRIVPARGPPQPMTQLASATTTTRSTSLQTSSTDQNVQGHFVLKSLDIAHFKTTITSAISSLTSSTSTLQRKTLVILDNPDLLLALNPALTLSAMTSLISTIHTLPNVSHVLSHIQADNPLLSLSSPPQPLEVAHHNFLVKLAHMSGRIIGVRVLDTGVARDVSGVIRITEQAPNWVGFGFEDGSSEKRDVEKAGKGKEFLYQVKGDGSVKVYERGAGGEG